MDFNPTFILKSRIAAVLTSSFCLLIFMGLNQTEHAETEKQSNLVKTQRIQTLSKIGSNSVLLSSRKSYNISSHPTLHQISDHTKRLQASQTKLATSFIGRQPATDYKNQPIRIQFSSDGTCVGITGLKKSLVVSFCDPTENQAFLFADGKLKLSVTSDQVKSGYHELCVGMTLSTRDELGIVDCGQAVRFTLSKSDRLLLKTGKTEDSDTRCMTSLQKNSPSPNSKLGAIIALTPCKASAPRVTFLNETEFLLDRAALMQEPLNRTICDFPACGANRRPPMAKLLSEKEIHRCQNLSECLSVVVKTSRRPLLVLRLAESIRNVLKLDLPMIVVDDGPNSHPIEIMDQIAQFPKIKYVVAQKRDLGISEGRMIGIKMVQSKYFVNLDDDNIVTKSWNASKMTELLDTTDISLVGGKTDSNTWPSFIEFGYDEDNNPSLFHYHGSCKAAKQTLPFYPGCMRCDLTSNSFIAKTADVLEVGGWSRELKIQEHQDLFLRLKAAGKKVVWCPEFHVLNAHFGKVFQRSWNFFRKRQGRIKRMNRIFNNHWNIKRYVHVKNALYDKTKSWLHDL